MRARIRLEMAASLVAGGLGILTVFWRDWIEVLTGRDLDHHDGGAEWILVAGLLTVAVTVGLAARRHGRLLSVAPLQAAASGGQGGQAAKIHGSYRDQAP